MGGWWGANVECGRMMKFKRCDDDDDDNNIIMIIGVKIIHSALTQPGWSG